MPSAPVRIDRLPWALPRRNILARLGYRTGLTRLPEAEERRLDGDLARLAALCRDTRAVFLAPLAVQVDEAAGVTTVEGGWRIECPGVARMLRGARALWLGAATLGDAITAEVRARITAQDAAGAAIADAVGGECADAAMDALQDYARQRLLPLGFALASCRFSPGYGGWALEAQREIHRRLALGELGVSLSESCILLPEKTVTAIAPLL